MINVLRRGLMFALFFLVMSTAYAQEPGTDPPPGDPNEDPQVPISAIWILVAGGAAYGARKAYVAFRGGKH